jgi:arylsulfatase A-like enzyme
MAHYFDPHYKYLSHPGFTEKFPPREPAPRKAKGGRSTPPRGTAEIRSLYEGEVAFTDHAIGRLLDHVEKLDLYDETIVVLSADHGEELWDRSRRGHGHQLFNELVHVPLIIRIPGWPPGKIRSPVGNVDIGPTLAELCGIRLDVPQPGGESLVPLLEDPAARRSAPVLSSRFPMELEEQVAREPRDWYRVDWGDSAYIHVESGRRGSRFLFDWTSDPGQQRNLLEERPVEAREIEALHQRIDLELGNLSRRIALLEKLYLTDSIKDQLRALGYADDDSAGTDEPAERSGE